MTIDLLRPPALDHNGVEVGHRVLGAHYLEFFAHQLDTVTLSQEQALTLCDVIATPIVELDDQRWRHPGPSIAAAVRAAATVPHHNERWGTDFTELAVLCESWHPAQALAVLGAITRSRSVASDWVGSLHAVRLLR